MTLTPRHKALPDKEWKRIGRGELTLRVDDRGRCIVQDRQGHTGIGVTPLQALEDMEAI